MENVATEEFISRTEALEDFESCNAENPYWTPQRVKTLLLRQPAADVAEVRHGRWERVSTASGIISRVRCSVCAGTQPLTFENMPYCPTCGARMDEEDGHEIS